MKPKPIDTINDWRPEVKSLFRRLTSNGFALVESDNGDDDDSGRLKAEQPMHADKIDAFVAHTIACDEAWVTVVHLQQEKLYTLYLVLGNSPGELICDYSYPKSGDLLEPVAAAHSEEWESKPQPLATGYYGDKGWVDVDDRMGAFREQLRKQLNSKLCDLRFGHNVLEISRNELWAHVNLSKCPHAPTGINSAHVATRLFNALVDALVAGNDTRGVTII